MRSTRWLAGLAVAAIAHPVSARQPFASVADALDVAAFEVQDLGLPGERAPFTLDVRLGGRSVRIGFSPNSVRGPGFRVLVQDDQGQLVSWAPPEETTFRGTVQGEPGAIVAATLDQGRLTAMIRLDREVWNIQPLSVVAPDAPARTHIVSRESAMLRRDWSCGVEELSKPFTPSQRPPRGPGGTDSFLTCQLAVDADHEFYVLNGSSVNNTTSDIAGIVNAMSAIYQADANVTFALGTVVVRQSATQPYTSTDSNALLTQFETEWTTNQSSTVRDTAHLFTGKDLDGSTIGLAYVGTICSSTLGFGLSQSRFSGNFSFRVGVTAHEVGHNFNAGHCDTSCTPCRIMCGTIGGCSGSATDLGCSKSVISSFAQVCPCLSQFNNGLDLPFVEPFTSTTLNYNRWPTPANAGGVVNTAAVTEPSSPNALDLANTASITTAGIDLTATGGRPVFVSFWSEHRGVESGKTLAVAYRRPTQNDFQPLVTLTSNGVDQSTFSYTEVALPAGGLGANGAIRFTAQGNQADDHWYIDDVKVSLYCRADTSPDGALNIQDYRAMLDAFAAGNTTIADWNGDGILNILDFTGFVNAFATRCPGY
jgi:hypothetical protein